MCPERILYYNMKPGYVYPQRNNKIVQLTNKVHLYFWHYFPDYNQWLFNYIIDKEIYLIMDELNTDKVSKLKGMLAYQPIKYLKIVHMPCASRAINGLTAYAERVYLQNVVVENLCKDV